MRSGLVNFYFSPTSASCQPILKANTDPLCSSVLGNGAVRTIRREAVALLEIRLSPARFT